MTSRPSGSPSVPPSKRHSRATVASVISDASTRKKVVVVKELSPKAQKKEQKKKEQEFLEKIKTHQIISFLTKKTKFDTEQVRALCNIYKIIVSQGKLDRLHFRESFALTFGILDDTMLDRIFFYFDGDNQGTVSESEWIMGLNLILRGTLDEQISYCYEVYDINGDHSIGREELAHCLKNSLYSVPTLTKEESEDLEAEGHRELVELAMRKFDTDRDGQIKEEEFRAAVHNDPLLLQAIGECLPPPKALMTFLQMFTNDVRNFSTFYSHPQDLGWDRERDKFRRAEQERIRKQAMLDSAQNSSEFSTLQKMLINQRHSSMGME